MRTASVLPFSTIRRGRAVKATLHSETRAAVQRVIVLAPVLGQCRPGAVPTVEAIMHSLIDNPEPPGGLHKRALPSPAKAAHRRRAPRANVVRPDPQVTAMMTSAWDTFATIVRRYS